MIQVLGEHDDLKELTMTTTATREIVLDAPRDRDLPGISEKNRVSATVLRMHCKHSGHVSRLMVSYTPADGLSRREFQGPILPGPYASTFPLASVIDNFGGTAKESADMTAAEMEYEVTEGDEFLMDGIRWVIRDDVWLHYPRLYPVGE